MPPADTSPHDHAERMHRLRLSLDGLSVGDAFGERFFVPHSMMESMMASRALPAAPWRYTDDTAMATSIAAVLGSHGRIDQDELAQRFALRYAEDSARGYGATAHEILRSIGRGENWRDVSPIAFGGEGSMGNGGAMRVGPVGAYFADDLDAVVEQARASAEVTHAHPDGQAGAIAVAVAAAQAWRMRDALGAGSRRQLIQTVIDHTPDGPTRDGLRHAIDLPFDSRVETAVRALGNGSRVIASDTVPFCIWCAARHLDSYEAAMWTTVSGLGDCDTTCAIVGGIVSLAVGRQGIPSTWLDAREPLDFSF